jgi:hypothetical protein
MVVHAVDGPKVAIPPHKPILKVRLSALDPEHTSSPWDKADEGQPTTETWLFDLAGKQVSILDQSSESDSLEYDTSDITTSKPAEGDAMSSTRWIPDLKRLSGASKRMRDDAFNCQIVLKRGRIEGARPTTNVWRKVVWTFKNPNSNAVVLEQALTDTVLYRCPLNGQSPVIRIGSDIVTLKPEPSEGVVIENLPDMPPPNLNDPFSLGHFGIFYELVDRSFRPVESPEPLSREKCSDCDVGPVFCPPAEI